MTDMMIKGPSTDPANDIVWTGPYGGLPPFASLTAEALDGHYRSAIKQYRAAALAVAADKRAPGFANTLEPLQQAQVELARAEALYRFVRYTAMSAEAEPILSKLAGLKPALEDELAWNRALFSRIEAAAADGNLTISQKRTAELVLGAMKRRGAGLPESKLTRLQLINQQLTTLETRFQANLIDDAERLHIALGDEAELDGLGEATIATLKAEAASRGLSEPYCVPCARPIVDTILSAAHSRDLRESVWRMFSSRGKPGNPDIVRQILALRAEKAQLMDFANYADFMAHDRMAQTGDKALALVETIARHAVAAAEQHGQRLAQLPQARSIGGVIEPWDRPYLNEFLSAADRGFNAATLSEYLALPSMIDGMFWAAEALYDCTFARIDDALAYRPDVTVYEVRQRGRVIGLLYLDLFRRPGKRGLAWMDEYRGRLRGQPDVPAIVAVNHYLSPPVPDRPVLLSWEEVRVLFHELGHALHALLSEVEHPAQGMTQVAWDMIEMPSQLFEHLVTTPEVLSRYATHWRTGESMPEDMQAQLSAGALFDPGAWVLSLAGPALVDLNLHRIGAGIVPDPEFTERNVLAAAAMPRSVSPRHGVLNFAHIFAESYAAGYYCYHWADVMVADAIEVFEAEGGLFEKATAERFERELLGVGAAVPPGDAYRAFARREPAVSALIRKLGLDL